MGLQGMINDLIKRSDYSIGNKLLGEINDIQNKNINAIARMISASENCPAKHRKVLEKIKNLATKSSTPILGVTGTGGAGKSSLVDELVRRFILVFQLKILQLYL